VAGALAAQGGGAYRRSIGATTGRHGAAQRAQERKRDAHPIAGVALPEPDVHVSVYRRIAALHADLAAAYEELADAFENRLAAAHEQSDMRVQHMATLEIAGKPRTQGEKLLTVRELAELLNVDARTVRRWRGEGKLPPAISVSGIVRWHQDVIAAWLAEREEAE